MISPEIFSVTSAEITPATGSFTSSFVISASNVASVRPVFGKTIFHDRIARSFIPFSSPVVASCVAMSGWNQQVNDSSPGSIRPGLNSRIAPGESWLPTALLSAQNTPPARTGPHPDALPHPAGRPTRRAWTPMLARRLQPLQRIPLAPHALPLLEPVPLVPLKLPIHQPLRLLHGKPNMLDILWPFSDLSHFILHPSSLVVPDTHIHPHYRRRRLFAIPVALVLNERPADGDVRHCPGDTLPAPAQRLRH